jgi:choline-sulfatase
VSRRRRRPARAWALAAAIAGAACRAAPAPHPPNVLIYLVDTLRADHLGCYGYDRAVSPAIDGFAGQAIRFENAVAQSSWTRPTVASVLTGLTTLAHGVRSPDDGLAGDLVTLPELLRPAGYATAGFSPNWHVSPATGFAQGFDEFQFFPEDAGSEALTRRVLAWLDRTPRGKPWMVYAHALDPHAPYQPPDDLRRAFAGGVSRPGAGSHADIVEAYRQRRRDRGARVEELRQLYDAEIADTDRHFGRLLEGLRSRGLYDGTLVIFLADHGEGFDEHALLGHGNSLYGELLNIPLIVKPAGDGEAGRVESALARQIDVLPTILGAARLEPGRGLSGRDLLAPRQYSGDAFVIAQLTYEKRNGVALVTREWKYVEPRSRRFGRQPQLFARGRDPLDQEDLAAGQPAQVAALRALLHRSLELSGLRAPRVAPDAEGRDALRALGYL